jgi:hypothetical protein
MAFSRGVVKLDPIASQLQTITSVRRLVGAGKLKKLQCDDFKRLRCCLLHAWCPARSALKR